MLFFVLGTVGALFMFFQAEGLAGFLENSLAAQPIRALAPAVFCVCLLACMRGYTQGQGNMTPTAVSQVLEALLKLAIGLPLAWYVLRIGMSLEMGAAAAILGVTAVTAVSLSLIHILRTCYETVVSQHRLEDLPRFVEEGCVLRQGEWTTPLGPGGMVRHLAALRETYPDYTVRILRQHWAAPYVVSECVMEGTHLGPWPGTVPTGKRLIFTGVNIDRVEGGKIVEHGGAVNTFETLWDAGMIRPAE